MPAIKVKINGVYVTIPTVKGQDADIAAAEAATLAANNAADEANEKAGAADLAASNANDAAEEALSAAQAATENLATFTDVTASIEAANTAAAEAEVLINELEEFVDGTPSVNLVNENLVIPLPSAPTTDNISGFIPVTPGTYYCVTVDTERTLFTLYLYDAQETLLGTYLTTTANFWVVGAVKTTNFSNPTESRTGGGFLCPEGVAFAKVRCTHSRTNRTISAFSDGGNGTTIVTGTNNGTLLFPEQTTAQIVITASTDYDGTYTGTYINANSFSIVKQYTQTRTGKAARYNYTCQRPMMHESTSACDFLRWVTGIPEYILDADLIAEYRAADLATAAAAAQVIADESIAENNLKFFIPTDSINLLDESAATVNNTDYKTSAHITVTPSTRVIVSTGGNSYPNITPIKCFDASDNELAAPEKTAVYLDEGAVRLRSGYALTTPSDCAYMTVGWRFWYNGAPLNYDLMLYYDVGDDLVVPYMPFNTYAINTDALPELAPLLDKVRYVSPDGDDDSDGKTALTPYATFAKACLDKPNVIYAVRGDYGADDITINNQEVFKILPYDNGDEYDYGDVRTPISINNGVVLSSLTLVSGLLEQTYAGGYNFDHVFTTHADNPIFRTGQQGLKVGYCHVWQNFADADLDERLIPVLTKAETSVAGTFFWDGTKIYINPYAGDYTGFTACSTGNRVSIHDVKECVLQDVASLYMFENGFFLHNIADLKINNCSAKYCGISQGFGIDNTNVVAVNCCAFKSGTDGFNLHGFGASEFLNCCARYNYDDGMSHHDGCVGVVNGGEYSYNQKNGNAPAYGAQINVYNILAKANYNGITYATTPNGHAAMLGNCANNLLIDNAYYGLAINALATVTVWGNKYSGNITGNKLTAGTLNDYD